MQLFDLTKAFADELNLMGMLQQFKLIVGDTIVADYFFCDLAFANLQVCIVLSWECNLQVRIIWKS